VTIFLAAVSFVTTATLLLLAVRRLCGFNGRKPNEEERESSALPRHDSGESRLRDRNQRDRLIVAAVVKNEVSNNEQCVSRFGNTLHSDRPKEAFMGGHPFPEIPCTICSKPVDLTVDLFADEHGKSIHEDCYIKHLASVSNLPDNLPDNMMAD
jgi:hypothetical protein